MPQADVTNEAREREQAPRETVSRIPQATTTDGNRQPTPVAVLLFRTGDVFLLISSVVNIFCWCPAVGHWCVRLSDTGVSGYRTLVCPAIGHWCATFPRDPPHYWKQTFHSICPWDIDFVPRTSKMLFQGHL